MSLQPGDDTKHLKWNCVCDCGTQRAVRGDHLRGGRSPSCGCMTKERMTTHGMYKASEYFAWNNMLRRCEEPDHPEFKNYGARGIAVCDAWHSFEAFFADVGARPSSAHSLDRIDNNGPYNPSNCRWATAQQQSDNRRSNQLLTLHGRTMTITKWAKEVGVNPTTIKQRLRCGWPLQRALTEPAHGFPNASSYGTK
jgi:hypothetical protein